MLKTTDDIFNIVSKVLSFSTIFNFFSNYPRVIRVCVHIHTQEVNYKKEERARLPATTHNTFTSHACATPSKKDLYYTYLHGI